MFFNWWDNLDLAQQVFYAIGGGATLIVVLQTLLAMLGLGDGDADFDVGGGDVDLDADADFDGPGMFSVRSICAFFVGFGWAGAVAMQAGLSIAIALFLALIAGVIMAAIIVATMRALWGLRESGNISSQNTVGLAGTVYLRIPGNRAGRGKVQLTVQERLREFDALTDSLSELPTGSQIRVTRVEGDLLIVEDASNSPRRALDVDGVISDIHDPLQSPPA